MKVKNITDSPMQLGDGRMIGVNDERDYDLQELTMRDRKRFESGKLEVIKELPADAEKTSAVGGSGDAAEKPNALTGAPINGGKTNVK